jgi:transposase-like protein
MVLVLGERGSGRTRMRVIPDARAVTLEPLLAALVAPGSTVITDSHAGYQHLPALGYTWDRRPHPAGGMTHGSPHVTPLVDGLIAQMQDWLRATYRKPPADLGPYLGEFCFRREVRDPAAAFRLLLTAPIRRRPSMP